MTEENETALMMEQLAGDVRELTYTMRELVAVIEEMKAEKLSDG